MVLVPTEVNQLAAARRGGFVPPRWIGKIGDSVGLSRRGLEVYTVMYSVLDAGGGNM